MVITSILRNFKKCCLQGHLKALSTVGVEEILCGVTKLKNLIFAKGREYENMLSQKNLSFSLFKIAFWIILHQTPVDI